jgi:hypothetical protein
VSRARTFADTAPGPPRKPRLSTETLAIPPRSIAPGWSSTARYPAALLSLSSCCCAYRSLTHSASAVLVVFCHPLHVRRNRRKKWRGRPLHRPVTLTGTLYRSFAPCSYVVCFSVAPPPPRKTHWLPPAAPTKFYVPPISLHSGFPEFGPGGNSIRCEVLIATAMPCALKPLCHRDRCCGAPCSRTLRISR